ncbi:UNVERIFIED_CONTAM: hypothetical protein NY603_27515, partial [Bacteroidetes bacterium 56_B9]
IARFGRLGRIDIGVRVDPDQRGIGVMPLDSGMCREALPSVINLVQTHQRVIPSKRQGQLTHTRNVRHLVRHPSAHL